MDGGSPSPIVDVRNFVGASWSEDGSIVYGQAFVSGLLRIPADGGTPISVTQLGEGELVHLFQVHDAPVAGEDPTPQVAVDPTERPTRRMRGPGEAPMHR